MEHPETWQALRKLIAFRNTAPRLAPAVNSTAVPLSLPQERLWFLQQLNPQGVGFNVPFAIHLDGALDVAVLERSLNALRERQAALRTTFKIDTLQKPMQLVLPYQPVELERVDLSDLQGDMQVVRVKTLGIQYAREPFNLTDSAQFRTKLLTLNDQKHVLLLIFHHIIFDYWSQSILVREWEAIYKGILSDEAAKLRRLPIQYSDFAIWQQAWLGDEETRAPLKAYWQEQLANLQPLKLPTTTNSDVGQNAGGLREMVLSADLSQNLKAIAKQERDTLFTVLCAAFKVLIFQYTGQTDIFISTPMANRNRRELDNLIGNFVNLVVLRTDLSADPTFQEVLARTRTTMAGAIANQDFPLQFIDAPIQLTYVVFGFRNTPQRRLNLPDISAEIEVLDNGEADFDLFFDLMEENGQIGGRITYNRRRFTDATVAQMIANFTTLLEQFATQPDAQLSTLPSFVATTPETTAHPTTAAQTATEQQLVDIWKSALEIVELDIHTSFFDLGGNSLLLLQAHKQVQEAFSAEIPPVRIFQYPTIHALAKHIDQLQAANGSIASASVQTGQARADRKRAARQKLKRRKKR